jgi:hypothetical protein
VGFIGLMLITWSSLSLISGQLGASCLALNTKLFLYKLSISFLKLPIVEWVSLASCSFLYIIFSDSGVPKQN